MLKKELLFKKKPYLIGLKKLNRIKRTRLKKMDSQKKKRAALNAEIDELFAELEKGESK